jgi:inward rectifier potassium channel
LMFRVANQRHNFILEATAQVYAIVDEITAEGDFMRRIHELKLIRHRTPSLVLTWTVMHTIDSDSPLYGLTMADLQQRRTNISVLVSGVDETVAYGISGRYLYNTGEILSGYKFEDIIIQSANGDRFFDYSLFHQVRQVDSSENRKHEIL